MGAGPVTGPEHYRRAENLAEEAYNQFGDDQEFAAGLAAVAQIHATLALAAATALGGAGTDEREWRAVARKRAPE